MMFFCGSMQFFLFFFSFYYVRLSVKKCAEQMQVCRRRVSGFYGKISFATTKCVNCEVC